MLNKYNTRSTDFNSYLSIHIQLKYIYIYSANLTHTFLMDENNPTLQR